ncbi:spore germination protein [Brevibacillus nitrificans]|uniref:Spore germination protein n=1 Tax=Brevibacillus nitrificans TaxID=651560 RepID=A0A3M8DKQ7_9BACL|nr:spore germination protein [Brevibacillus nitrificans]RNB87995.1 spore germination protein [Brevibacillus nitrificans]
MFQRYRKKVRISQARQSQSPDKSSLNKDLQQNLRQIQQQFGFTDDLLMRQFALGNRQQLRAALVFLDGLSDQKILDRDVIEPLMKAELEELNDIAEDILSSVLHITLAKLERSFDTVLDELSKGKAVLLIHTIDTCIVVEAKAVEQRSVEEPVTEAVVRGPREGFTESITTNLALIRKRCTNVNLQVENYRFGTQTGTRVCMIYIRHIVKEELLVEVRKRLSVIKTDAILDSGYIEQWIEDEPFSIFPTVANSEKPDIVLSKLLEGRIAILVDGTPVALSVPATFQDFFQNAEDYYSRPFYASLIRLLRYAAFFISAFLPSLYISFENFQKELIPTPLLFSFVNSREGVPFPLAFELLVMVVVYEWLREAGLRMPRPIGQAVSIVGALVMGEAAVSAGLIGAPTVIIIALSAITSFIVPSLTDVVVMFRFLSIFASALFGLYGNFLIFYAICVYLADLRSFGIPYLAPLAPVSWKDWKDFLIRLPLWMMRKRPDALETASDRRIPSRSYPASINKNREKL